MSSTFDSNNPGCVILMQDVSGSMVKRQDDSTVAFNSAVRGLVKQFHKGGYFLRAIKLGIVKYNHLVCYYREPEWIEEYSKAGRNRDWADYEPEIGGTTNMLKAYDWALKFAKAHREEYPDSCIVILNITDGDHNENISHFSPSTYEPKKDVRRMSQVAGWFEDLDSGVDRPGSVDGRCVLGYLFYQTDSAKLSVAAKTAGAVASFPSSHPGADIPVTLLPKEFVSNLVRKAPRLVRKYSLSVNAPVYYYMTPDDWARIADFIQIGTTTMQQNPTGQVGLGGGSGAAPGGLFD